ncbi:ABC transporter permease [Tenacibaculum retecalamus]|uniref:ABC transporter permease n=1 Tax=Tenacibaculum retecalamus TaxID=3018315 RepID=UPI0023D9074A|nr:ABC transporter permease [Tenacibaculum retecalamus]WBX70045.1 ABC transporter permease [Tenacibaculum retecalamus]
MIQTWFKIFFRNSKKNWLNILVNILGLTLGFAGLLIVLLFLKEEESYNVNNSNVNEIYRVLHKMSDGAIWNSSTSIEGPKYKEEVPEIVDYYQSNQNYRSTVIKINEKQVFTTGILSGEPNFFDFFSFKIIEGTTHKFKEARNHLALSEEKAKVLFGDTSAIGKTLEIYNRAFIVTTVYKIIGNHYYMPNVVIQNKKQPKGNWGDFNDNIFVKTIKGIDIESVTKKVNDVLYKDRTLPRAKRSSMTIEEYEEKYGIEIILDPLKDIRLQSKASSSDPEGKGNYQLILIMLSLSILLIIISCVNFINLSIASATQRAKEVGVKKTLGLSKLTLTRQYTLEIVLQGIIAFVFSLLLVEITLPSFNNFMDKDISIFNLEVLTKIGLLAIIVSIIIGNIPAIYLSNFKAVEVLKGNVSKSKKGVLSRNIMLGMQFLISGFFLTGSIIINEQVGYMMEKELGFKADQIVVIRMHSRNDRYKKYQLTKKELIKHPNINAVTSNSFAIGGEGIQNSTNLGYKGNDIQSNSNAIDFNYLDLMNVQILKGRNLKENRASDTINSILINETLAKSFNIYEDPIGKKLKLGWLDGTDNVEVIGMVKDYHTLGLDSKIPPTFFLHWNTVNWVKNNFETIQIKIKPNNIEETLSYIEVYWQENVEQGYPFKSTFINDAFAKTYKEYKNQQILFFILTLVVILVSLLGLFALATLTIQQRLKEVAIRKTLGASIKEIMVELIKSFLKITLIASVILIPIAYYIIEGWLENFVYRIDMPIYPFIITPIILTILVFVVVGLKAYNATKIDLIKYLKFE